MPSRSPGTARGFALAALAFLGLLLAPGAARAHSEYVGFSPGIKLGYTPGYGFTTGIEISWVWLPAPETGTGSMMDRAVDLGTEMITESWGVVLNLDTNFRDLFKVRVGGEWIGPFVGVEAGPSFVIDRDGKHAALGLTPWVGYQAFGYYTYTYVFGDAANLHELGLYLKSPLLGFDGDGHSSDWD
jgi:hypothetical protein